MKIIFESDFNGYSELQIEELEKVIIFDVKHESEWGDSCSKFYLKSENIREFIGAMLHIQSKLKK